MHTTPRNPSELAPRATAEPVAQRDEGARFEAPLYTVPYPTVSMQGSPLDARDVEMDDMVPYRQE